jgi:tetratricopeptide (TPR) repeat protein
VYKYWFVNLICDNCSIQVQLKRWADVETTINLAKMLLADIEGYDKIEPQLNEVLASASAGKEGRAPTLQFKPSERTNNDAASNAKKAEQFKERGNSYYKQEEYQDAIRFYTQAISLCPTMGAYYGNRAAAWVMLKEYRRGVQDCADGVAHEKVVGQFDKLRQRQANALAGMGQRDKAIAFLEEALLLEREETTHVQLLETQLQKLKTAETWITSADESLNKREFSRAKRLFQNAQAEGMTDDPYVLLGIAKCCLGVGDYEDASRFSQKAISAGGSSVSTETYLVRADALQATGCTDLAQKHLTVALQMDPDNSVVQQKLKKMRKTVAETARVRASVDEAMNLRKFELAISRCAEGFQIDKEAKKLIAEFHEKRAKVWCSNCCVSQNLIIV